jgi:hypothetical protein
VITTGAVPETRFVGENDSTRSVVPIDSVTGIFRVRYRKYKNEPASERTHKRIVRNKVIRLEGEVNSAVFFNSRSSEWALVILSRTLFYSLET